MTSWLPIWDVSSLGCPEGVGILTRPGAGGQDFGPWIKNMGLLVVNPKRFSQLESCSEDVD
jgi:hypothetical protein